MKKSYSVLKSVLLLTFILVMSNFVLGAVYHKASSIADSSSGVHINEVELNPNSGNEWIELYNNGPTIDLTGWYLIDKDSNRIINLTVTELVTGGFYVSEVVENTLVDNNEHIQLYNSSDMLQDDTGVLGSDTNNNDKTWSRVPDGNGSFVLQQGTKGITNLLDVPVSDIVIGERTVDPSCVFYDEAITLKAVVNGSCIDQVLFNVNVNGNLTNFTSLKINGNYSYTIHSNTFNQAGNVDWKVIVKDCYDRIVESGIETINLHDITKLSISPLEADGLGGWYISEPSFTLENAGASNIWYRWDNAALKNYEHSFGLEDTPNNGNTSGGILELKWFSDICALEIVPNHNESIQTKSLKIDLANPTIKDIVPGENGIIYNNLKPKISANFDEVYNENSGINGSSTVLRVDGVDVTINATIKTKNGDESIEYTPGEDLTYGNHTIDLSIDDKAGRSSEKSWTFEIKSKGPFEMNVYAPLDGSYNNTTRILFNVTTNEIVERIEYINYNEPKPKWKKLCVNCNAYDRPNTLKEGTNNITIKATDNINQVKEKNVVLYIDSKKPKISTTRPKSSDITNGDFFYIKYNENNLQKVELFWNSSVGSGSKVLDGCSAGNNEACSTSVDLSSFNGKEITYWFEVSDLTNKVSSKKVKVRVDTGIPIINVFMPEESESYWKNVPFNITVSEKVNIEYIDNADAKPKWKTLCGNCDSYGYDSKKNKPFKKGAHNLTIIATDKAGNLGYENIYFSTEL